MICLRNIHSELPDIFGVRCVAVLTDLDIDDRRNAIDVRSGIGPDTFWKRNAIMPNGYCVPLHIES